MSMNEDRRIFVKVSRARTKGGEGERWDVDTVSPTLNTFDNGDSRSVTLVARKVRKMKPIYLDDQGGKIMNLMKDDCSPTLLLNAAKAHGLIVCRKQPKKQTVRAFAQNTRNEVRFIGEHGEGDISGALAAEPGAKQTTYLLITKGTKK